jgi:hypothetical protein
VTGRPWGCRAHGRGVGVVVVMGADAGGGHLVSMVMVAAMAAFRAGACHLLVSEGSRIPRRLTYRGAVLVSSRLPCLLLEVPEYL